MARDYKKIKAWIVAKKFVLDVYKASKDFPKEELYGLTSQLRRAVVSAANIAEGSSRQHKRDYLNFLYNSKASLAEADCLLELAKDLKYINEDVFSLLSGSCEETARILYGLIQAVEYELSK